MKSRSGSSSALRAHVSRLFLLTFLLASTAAHAVPPTLTAIPGQSVREGETLNIVLTATDDDGDAVTFSISNAPGFCTVTDAIADPNGEIQCSPGEFDDGNYPNVTVTATDDSGPPEEFSSDSFNLTVTENAAPNLSNITNQSVEEGDSLSILFNASDADGADSLSFTPSGFPASCGLVDNGDGTGSVDCNPVEGDEGVYNPVRVTVTDDAPFPLEDFDDFRLEITANAAPTLTPIPDQNVAEGALLDISLNASDTDNMIFTTSALPAFCSLTDNTGPSGTISCNPGASTEGFTDITVTVTDDGLIPKEASDTFRLTVGANAAPVLTPIADQSMAEGEVLNIPLGATDSDNMTFSTTGLPGFCSLTDATGPAGAIDCSPLAGDDGAYPVTVTVTDDGPIPASASDPFLLTVGANAAPVLTPIADQSMAEGEVLNIPLSATDTDNMTFSTTGLPTFCTLTDNTGPSGDIDCSPLAGDDGAYPVTVTVTDDGPIPASASDLFLLTVGANAAPVLTPIADQSMIEGAVLNIPLSATDTDNMTFSTTGLPVFCSLTDSGNGSGAIDCSPLVGDDGAYPVTVTVTDDGPIPASASDLFLLTVGANAAPTANGVAITGTLAFGEILTGVYTYADAELDLEGVSTFRWLRDGQPIPGEIGTTYTVVAEDVEAALVFEVTPVALTGALTGLPVQSPEITVSNVAPSITGQAVLETLEENGLLVTLADLTVDDADSTYPDDFTITAQPGLDYTLIPAIDNTAVRVTPALDINGPITVPVTVNDGFANSPSFDLVITVTPVNDAPVFVGVVPPGLTTPEDTTLTILLANLVITDPDNVVPDDITLTLADPGPADNYTLAGATAITPALNFNGQLSVLATVSDLDVDSAPFVIPVDVDPENDLPVVVTPIGPQQAIENSPFVLDVKPNFSDDDVTDVLSYSVIWPGGKPPNIDFNQISGTFSGTPRFVDTEVPGPNYTVVVTATDNAPIPASVSDAFDLTINALGRANLGLSVEVTPDTALPSDQLRWTFTTGNPVGPVPGESVELSGSFIGSGITVTGEGGGNCTITFQAAANRANFVCALGALPVGSTLPVVFTTTTSQATEVIAFATAAGTQPTPIDPNLDDNSAIRAVGVAESFSIGAVQSLGSTSIRSVAAGDVNGDGSLDLVVGTGAGQPVQVYFGDALREACQCQRDFLTAPISIPDTGSNEGIALADFDGNGALDIVIANSGGQSDTVYGNDGAGNFTLLATLDPSNGQDVAVGDFDNDGNMDIVVAAASPNPVYLGNGNGGFTLHASLGNADSYGVAVGRMDANNGEDLVFANVGSDSRVWTKNGGAGFTSRDLLPIGDAVSVAAADLNFDGQADLVFGRIPTIVGDIPSNPVLINQGTGTFGAPSSLLGMSPTSDVMIGDVNEDASPDLVFVNESGVHQIWVANGGGYDLHPEQIIDIGAVSGALASLGDTDNGDPGGADLAIGGAILAGVGVYLNDSAGNLGRGDAVVPVITLLGDASVSIQARSVYIDAGAAALDNIDGDIVVEATSTVNTSVVGNYIVTYNATDFAGNAAVPVVRNVTVTPASGSGGGGGGTMSIGLLVTLFGFVLLNLYRRHRGAVRQLRPVKIREDNNNE